VKAKLPVLGCKLSHATERRTPPGRE
jgi:hypothetical protein